MSTFYLAGRLDTGEASIGSFAVELENRGHTVLEKWWTMGRLPKPYVGSPESVPAAQSMIDAARDSEIFILFATDDILGAAVEFGAALGAASVRSGKRVIIVNPYTVRQSVFYAHSLVTAVHDVAELRAQPWF